MTGAVYILAINMAVGLLLAASFFLMFVYDRTRTAALWIAAAYLIGSMNFFSEFLTPLPTVPARPAFVMATLFSVLALSLVNIGLAMHYRVQPPYLAMIAIIIFTVLHTTTMRYDEGNNFFMMLLYQMPLFMCQALGVGIVANAHLRDRLDEMLMVALTCNCALFLIRPVISLALGGWGSREEEYITTPYALVSQAISTITAVAIALVLLVVLMRELLQDLSQKSETDPLSGALNRRGFELRVNRKMPRLRKVPVSVVICDLDHFKSVNDTYGHAVGDIVINKFVEILKQCADDDMEIGRIGGEEFAVFLPGSSIENASDYCEAVRHLFSDEPIIPVAPEKRLSASFGIAERVNMESLWEIIHNADKALYAAKRAGRNRVHVVRADQVMELNAAVS